MRATFCSVAFASLALTGCSGATFGALPPQPHAEVHDRSGAWVRLSVTIPLARTAEFAPKYVSPNSGSMTIAVNRRPPYAVGLTPATNPGVCKGNGRTKPITCSLTIAAPPGEDTFAFKIYAQKLVNGKEPANATLLSACTTPAPVAVVAGKTNNLGSFSLGGVINSIVLSPNPIVALADGTKLSLTLKVKALDATGATIIAPGNYATPIALSIRNDPSGALSLATKTVVAPAANGVNTVTITYRSNRTLNDATITASAGLGTSATTHVTPITFSLSSPAIMVAYGSTRTVTLSEANYAGAFSVTGRGSEVLILSCIPSNCKPANAGGPVQLTLAGKTAGPALSVIDAHGTALGTLGLSVIAAPIFGYTGSKQTFVVPNGVTAITATLAGGLGGRKDIFNDPFAAQVAATIPVTSGETLALFVGGGGSCVEYESSDISGGFNGGGAGGAGTVPGCGGGGATDLRQGGDALSNRVLVAAGGGGSAFTDSRTQLDIGGYGGTPNGANGASFSGQGGSGATVAARGNGGSAGAGSPGTFGSLGSGGSGGGTATGAGGGGGGGGYFGGGGGGNGTCCVENASDGGGSGGGGSSYAESTATNVSMTTGVVDNKYPVSSVISLSW